MDVRRTGDFVPLSFNPKDGKVRPSSASRLADADKLARIRDHLDKLLREMSERLYGGQIAAEPFVPGGRTPCAYCDYRAVCRHADGEGERTADLPADPFAAPKPGAGEPAR